jgi:hypothetical protein
VSLVLAIVNAWRPSLSHLQEVEDFGTNPGALRMLSFCRIIFRQDLLLSSFFTAQCSRRPTTTLVQVGRR